MPELSLPIIGYMRSPFVEKFGIPRQPNLVQVESYIEMLSPYNDPLAFQGIDEFSHLWLIWQFHDNKQQGKTNFRPQVRPPRLGGNQKIGVFATRSMYRPAPVGLSVVQLQRIEQQGKSLKVFVTGSDLLDGTPILDIKPYIQYSDAIVDAKSAYAQDEPLRKTVVWSDEAMTQKERLIQQAKVTIQTIAEIDAVLAFDPRPAYQDDENRVYGMKFSTVDIQFRVTEQTIEILQVISAGK